MSIWDKYECDGQLSFNDFIKADKKKTKFKFETREISKEDALDMIKKYHYSNTLPKLNKYFLGFYLEDELVGVITLGWGTRPLHTIKRIFPSLGTDDDLSWTIKDLDTGKWKESNKPPYTTDIDQKTKGMVKIGN